MDICITVGKGLEQTSPALEIENLESGETKIFTKKSQDSTGEDMQRDYFSDNLGLKRKADVLKEDVDENSDAKRVKLDTVDEAKTELDTGIKTDVVVDAKMDAEKSEISKVTMLSDDDADSQDFAFEVIENSDGEGIEGIDDDGSSVNEKKVEKGPDWSDVIKATSSKASENQNGENNSDTIRKDKDYLRLESLEILPDENDVQDKIGNSFEKNKVEIDLKDDKNPVQIVETVVPQTEEKKTNMGDITSDAKCTVESVKEVSKIENKCKESQVTVSEKESAIPKTKPGVIVLGEIDLTDDTEVIAIPSDDEDTIQNTNNPMKIKIVSACSIKSKKVAGVRDTSNVVPKSKIKTPSKSKSVNVPQFQIASIENLNRVMQEKWHEEPCKQSLVKALVNSKQSVNSSRSVSNQLAKLQNNISKSPNLAFQSQGSKLMVQTSTPKGLHTTVPVQNLFPFGCNVSPVKGQMPTLHKQRLPLKGQVSPCQISTFQGQRFPLKGQGSPLKGQVSPLKNQSPVGSQVSPTKFAWETTKLSPSAASSMIANNIMQKNTSLKSRQLVNIENIAALCKNSKSMTPLQGPKPSGFIGSTVNTSGAYQKVTPQLGIRGSVPHGTGIRGSVPHGTGIRGSVPHGTGIRGSVPHGMGKQQNRNVMKSATNMLVGSGNNNRLRVAATAQQPSKPAKPVSKFNIPRKPLVTDVILIDGDDKSETINDSGKEALADVVVVLDSSNSNSNMAIQSESDGSKLKENDIAKDTVLQSKVESVNDSDQSKTGTEKETTVSCQTDSASLESVADIYDDIKSPPVQEADFVVTLNVEFDESDSDNESLLHKEIKKETVNDDKEINKEIVDDENLEDNSSVRKEQTKHVNDDITTQVHLNVLNYKSVHFLDVEIKQEADFKSPSEKLCDNSTNNYGIEEISSTSTDIDQVRQTKPKSNQVQKHVSFKKTVDTTRQSQPLQNFTANKSLPFSKKAKGSNCLWSDDENAGLIETYQEPDSTPYALEEDEISSSGHVIVLSDSD